MKQGCEKSAFWTYSITESHKSKLRWQTKLHLWKS